MATSKSASTTVMEGDFGSLSFAVRPEDLKKLQKIILAKVGDGKWLWRVTRSDGLDLMATDTDELLTDERLNDEPLAAIDVLFEGEQKVSVKICFNRDHYTPVALTVTGSDHDEVLLLTSALKKYIHAEVLLHQPPKWIGSIVTLIVGWFGLRYLARLWPKSHDTTLETILQSTDINEKLNYLIQHGASRQDPLGGLYTVASLIFIGVLFVAIYFALADNPIIFASLYPKNIFLFGARKQFYDKRVAWRNNILWVVVIGLVVNILVSLLLK